MVYNALANFQTRLAALGTPATLTAFGTPANLTWLLRRLSHMLGLAHALMTILWLAAPLLFPSRCTQSNSTGFEPEALAGLISNELHVIQVYSGIYNDFLICSVINECRNLFGMYTGVLQ